jgi:hypothetical protein
MECIYCNNSITDRKKGDHVIPQGLGKFTPEIAVFCICRKCDSKHGNEFERIALRTGILSTFRAIKGIKSKNNPKKPIHSPSLDKFPALESQQFNITNITNPNQTVYIGNEGVVLYANRIQVIINENITETIEIPPAREIEEICDFIEKTISKYPEETDFDLNICDEQQFEDVMKELRIRGRKLSDIRHLKQEPEFKVLKISTVVTDNHFRFVASTVLKAMIFLGYSVDLLHYLIEYVKKGDPSSFYSSCYVDQQESGMDTLDDPHLNVFYHTFEWNITESSLKIAASLLAHKQVNGMRLKLSVKTGEDKSIVIPYGKVIAKYGETLNDGTLEVFHGDHKSEI